MFTAAKMLRAAVASVSPPPPPPGGGGAGFGQDIMTAPAGFATGDLIFQDTFPGTSLNLAKWMPGIGAHGSMWDNFGRMGYDPAGYKYCGPNTDAGGVSTSADSELYRKAQVVVNDGLTITAIPNTAPLDPGGLHFPAISGSICPYNQPNSSNGVPPPSTANFTLPQTGKWYVQIRCKMPDMRAGIVPNLYFMPGPNSANQNELDFIQGGFGIQRTGTSALWNNYPLATGYFAGGSPEAHAIPDMGVDTTLAFHTYGCELNWTTRTNRDFFDGVQVYSYTRSTPFFVQPYQFILNIHCWKPGLGFATGYAGGTSSFQIAEVQCYGAAA